MEIEEMLAHVDYLMHIAGSKCDSWEDAQDLVQETILDGLHAIRKGVDINNARNWLCTVLKAEQKVIEQPDIEICRQVLLGNLGSIGAISNDENAKRYRGEAVLALLHALRNSLEEAIVCNSDLLNSKDGLDIIIAMRNLYEKVMGTKCYGYHSDFCFIDMCCVRIAGNIEDYDSAIKYFDSAYEHFTKFNQWRCEKKEKWEKQVGTLSKDLESDEQFESIILHSVIPSKGKVTVCESSFLEMAIHSFPEEIKKKIKDNPKYARIFNN